MTIAEILKAEKCKRLFWEVNNFVTESLKEYNDSFSEENCYSSKDIFDFTWGTVKLSPAEMIVLDSPLLQRLRHIHHLGMADVLYCNANSSRFSHTIGVIEASGRMARVVSSELGPNWGERDHYEEVVRMAAIFHDTGHMVYSHASENYFTHNKSFPRYSEISEALTDFCEKTSSNCSLHELISVMIVNADETRHLIENAANYMNWEMHTSQEFQTFTEYVSGLIIGIPVDSDILPFSQIINGAIDADKLDYLSRDSECTKVPIAVDVPRIIQKLTVVDIPGINFPQVWANNYIGNEFKIMGIKNSAKKVFFQLSSARSNMYESVYYHHKVLTAETMFRNLLDAYFVKLSADDINFKDIMSWIDDYFSEYWKDIPVFKADCIDKEQADEVSEIIKKLRNRNLYKRAAAFSAEYLTADDSDREIGIRSRFLRPVVQNPKSQEHRKFMEKIKSEYQSICSLLGWKGTNNKERFVFAFSKYEAMPPTPIENVEGCCVWSSKMLKQETMEAGKKNREEHFYLLTDCTKRDYAYLAFEKVLFELYGLRLRKDAAICLKTDNRTLQKTRFELLEKDYYKQCLSIINDDMFKHLVEEQRVEDIYNKYSSYQGKDGYKISKEKIYSFMRQFLILNLKYKDLKSILDGIIRLLMNGDFIDRKRIVDASNKWLNQLEESDRYVMVLVGDAKDSSSHYSYFFNDNHYLDKIDFSNSLQDALKKDENDSTICFYDDGACSGRQIVSVFQEYMGVPVEQRMTKEHHVDELTDEDKEKLKSKKIRLLFVLFNEENREFVLSSLKDLGIEDVDIIATKNMQKISSAEGIFITPQQATLVCDSLRKIGEALVRFNKDGHSGWDEDRIVKSAMGYNDAQQVVITATSVPTYTLPVLWMDGEYEQKKWNKLFARTKS